MKKVKEKLQVRHYPQIPCKPFCIDVKDEEEAFKISTVLAKQHLWLYKNRIIPDYCNVIGVFMYDEKEKEWVDYWNEEEFMEWDELIETYFKINV